MLIELFVSIDVLEKLFLNFLFQWEFQVGFCEGIFVGDDFWVVRYILYRVVEDFGVIVIFDFKLMLGDWNGVGVYINYSIVKMREDGGIK